MNQLELAMNRLEPGTLAQWFSAIATFLAVLDALFKEEVLRWRRRPKLREISWVSCKLEGPGAYRPLTFRCWRARYSANHFANSSSGEGWCAGVCGAGHDAVATSGVGSRKDLIATLATSETETPSAAAYWRKAAMISGGSRHDQTGIP